MVLLFDFIRRQFFYHVPVPTASFAGRTVIITGSNVGLGKEATKWLVKLGAAKIIMACRSLEKGEAAAKDIRQETKCSSDILEVWKLDLSSYSSVKAFAEKAKALPRLDAVIANAGLGTLKFVITEEDESCVTTNVVSTALLGFLLHPKLQETAEKYNTQTHLTFTASELYEHAKFKELKAPEGQLFSTLADEKSPLYGGQRDRYNITKLMDVFLVKQMAAMAPLKSSNVIINCIAPGFCYTSLHRDVASPVVDFIIRRLARPAEVGSRTLVYGASAGPETHGQYLPDCVITPTIGPCKGEAGNRLQQRIWKELSAKLERIQPGVTSIA